MVSEFHRIMKKGGKMIIDINGPGSDFSKHGKLIKDDLYEYRGNSGNEEPRLCYCPQTPERFELLFDKFNIAKGITNIDKLSDYFAKFKNFCFDLDVKNMLNGSFNFVYK